ncbi:hypothetical protein GF1_08530 [Desulfolithobacter dissulfuricans]|uniref:GspL periplasmic domain-containing protein n=1 Tax=Desulfolithobacter dissulfuricans TaxID=2795293 RepID=A0A915U122_9BACT|nr:hypothetical protein [Desulfolithobacter dissulfuricans]BCO08477.1 hypothetical protein GF1_08530 [Desulfolithobacter dissulfuricans]
MIKARYMALGSNKKKFLACFDPVRMRWSMAEVRRSGRKPVFSGAVADWEPTGNSGADLYCSLATPRTHLLLAEFPKLKKELLTLQINERIRQEGLYGEDIHFIQKIKKLDRRGDSQKLSVVSIPSTDLNPLLDPELADHGLRIRRIVPAPVAIAGLLGQFTIEPVLAAIFSEEGLQVLLVRDSQPLYSQMVPPDISGLFEEAMLAQTFETVRQNIRRLFSLEVDKFICLGQGHETCPDRIGGEDSWQPDWNLILEAESLEDVYRYPELYGTWFADPDYDCLPRSWRASYALQQATGWVTAGLLLAAAGLGAMGYTGRAGLGEMRQQYQRLFQETSARQRELGIMLPSDEERQLVEQVASLQARIRVQPRLENILATIAATIPDSVKIVSFTYRAGAAGTMPPGTSSPGPGYPPAPGQQSPGQGTDSGNRAMRVNGLLGGTGRLHIVFTTRGDLLEARSSFEEAISGLAKKYTLENVEWNYGQEAGAGLLECDLVLTKPDGEDRR